MAYTEDLCTGGTPAADSQYDGFTGPARAFDGATDGYNWQSGSGFPHWIGYQFSEAQAIIRVRIYQALSSYASAFIIEGSNDAESNWDDKAWTELHSATGASRHSWDVYDFTNETAYEFVRLRATSGENANIWSVAEIEMMAEEAAPSAEASASDGALGGDTPGLFNPQMGMPDGAVGGDTPGLFNPQMGVPDGAAGGDTPGLFNPQMGILEGAITGAIAGLFRQIQHVSSGAIGGETAELSFSVSNFSFAGRAKQAYPQSLNVWFADYPQKITMVCGPEFANLSGGTLSPGSRVVLTQTPNSQIPQGEYSDGQALPEVKAIYTDTGSDESYNVRLTFYGWGTFFSQAEANYWLEITHGMTIEAPGMEAEKDFRMWDYHYTGIPRTETVELVEMDDPSQGRTHVSRDEPRPTGTSGSGDSGWIAPTSFGTDQSMWGQWIIELLSLSSRTRLTITATPAPYSGAVTGGRLAGTASGCFMGVLCRIYVVSPQRIVAAFFANRLSSGQVVQEWIAAYYWDTIKADGVDITLQVRRAI